jgi:hypothetical protein
MSTRLALPARRNHITQKVRIAGQRTFYLSVHDDVPLAEIFLRLKVADFSSDLIDLYDVIARLMGLGLQYGTSPLEEVGDLLAGAKFEPYGPVVGHDRLKSCTSLPDPIGRHLVGGVFRAQGVGAYRDITSCLRTEKNRLGRRSRLAPRGDRDKVEPRWAPQDCVEVRDLAREHGSRAIERLVGLMESKNQAGALRAA